MYSKIELIVRRFVQHYNPKKYWKLRNKITNKDSYPKILKYIWLLIQQAYRVKHDTF